MDRNGIWSRYKDIMLIPHDRLKFNADDQSLDILFENDWIRILLIRYKEEPDQSTIEVELSLPDNDSEIVQRMSPKDILLKTITNLKFIEQLYDNGFNVQLVDHDWIWSASLAMTAQQENQNFFQNITPP